MLYFEFRFIVKSFFFIDEYTIHCYDETVDRFVDWSIGWLVGWSVDLLPIPSNTRNTQKSWLLSLIFVSVLIFGCESFFLARKISSCLCLLYIRSVYKTDCNTKEGQWNKRTIMVCFVVTALILAFCLPIRTIKCAFSMAIDMNMKC